MLRWYLLDHSLWRPFTVLPPALAALGLGMLLAIASVTDVVARIGPTLRRVVTSAALWWALAAVAFFVMTAHAATNPFFSVRTRAQEGWHDLLAPVVAVGIVAPFVLGPRRRGAIRALVGSLPLQWIGLVSYGAYLWHESLMAHIPGDHFGVSAESLETRGTWWCVFVGFVVLALTLAVAAVSWYGVERPIQRRARRVDRPRAPAPGRPYNLL